MKSRLLFHEKFRAGVAWQLVEWNRLDQQQKDWLLGLHEEQEIYGLFCPATTSSSVKPKVAYKDAAMIFMHLRAHDRLPHYFIADPATGSNDMIARLVLDNIIEIEWNDHFAGGAKALPALFTGSIYREKEAIDLNAALSMEAIRYAWLLDTDDVKTLARGLYLFNSVPWDHVNRQQFESLFSVRNFIFSQVGRDWQEQLRTSWFSHDGHERSGWFSWSRSRQKPSPGHPKIYKLYISPLINDLPAVFAKAIPVIDASDAISFKTGNTLQGLLRPDKMVVYFESPDALKETAALLEKEISDYPPQGVPFSKLAGAGGLLSSGADPLPVDFPEKIRTGSWRTIIADELALAIMQSKNEGLGWAESLPFIRARILAAGIDPENWSLANE